MSFRLIRDIQSDCRDLGTLLSIDEQTLEGFESNNKQFGQERVCKEILNEWMTRGEGDYEVTWAGLLQALKDAQLNTSAKRLQNALTLYFKSAS